MQILPAIDLKDGACVRLQQGDFNLLTVYNQDPLQVLRELEQEGANYLHVVDLDGALAGSSRNLEVVKRLVASEKMPIEVGGGIRSLQQIETVLALGVQRVILGSVAVKNPELVAEACRLFPQQVVAGIDAREGIVAVEGWCSSGSIEATELGKKMADVGIETIIFTDIARDGMLSGVNVEATVELAHKTGVGIIASGGVASIEDIRALKAVETEGVVGCIIGKAYYTGKINLAEAIALAGGGKNG